MKNLVEEVMKIRKEPITKQFMNWHGENMSELKRIRKEIDDDTNIKLWEQGIRDFSKTNGKALVEMVENIGV